MPGRRFRSSPSCLAISPAGGLRNPAFMVKFKCPKVDILSHVRPAKIPVHNLLFSKELFDNKPVPTGLLSLGQGGIKKTSTLGQGVPLIGPHGRSNIFPWPVQPIPLVQREFYLGGRD